MKPELASLAKFVSTCNAKNSSIQYIQCTCITNKDMHEQKKYFKSVDDQKCGGNCSTVVVNICKS